MIQSTKRKVVCYFAKHGRILMEGQHPEKTEVTAALY